MEEVVIAINNDIDFKGGLEGAVKEIVSRISPKMPNLLLIFNSRELPAEESIYNVKYVNLHKRYFVVNTPRLFNQLFLLDRLLYSLKLGFFCLSRRPKVLNIHGVEYAFFPSLFNFLCGKRLINKLIVSFHGLTFEGRYNCRRGLLNRNFSVLFTRLIILLSLPYCYMVDVVSSLGAENLIFITSHLEKTFKAYIPFLSHIKRRVVHNGFGVGSPSSYSPHSSASDGVPKLLIVGSTILGKGLDIALKVYARLHELGCRTSLYIVGFSSESEKVTHLIDGFPDIFYKDVLPHKDVLGLMQQSTIVIMPSRNEGLPLVFLEALSVGTPAIVSAYCHVDEIPGVEGCAKIIPNLNIDLWVSEVLSMLNNYSEFKNAVLRFKMPEEFSWDHIGDLYYEILSQ